jgi:hypothetical protein
VCEVVEVLGCTICVECESVDNNKQKTTRRAKREREREREIQREREPGNYYIPAAGAAVVDIAIEESGVGI